MPRAGGGLPVRPDAMPPAHAYQPPQPLVVQPVAQMPPTLPNHDPGVAHDVQLGQIFTNMRLAMKVSRDTIARRLATSVFVVDAFETGTVPSLPHWRETARIVRGYCELLKLDPEPILWRLKSHYHASGMPIGLLAHDGSRPAQAEAQPFEGPKVLSRQQRPPPRRVEVDESRRRRRRSRFLVLTAPVLLAAGIAICAQRAPDPIYAAVALLPDNVEAPARFGLDALVQTMAPVREGLRWVEMSDPQLRKSDKLQTSRR